METSDAALVAQVRAGNGDAYRVLVERYGRKIFGLAFRLTGNEEDAEDTVQETFLRAYRSLDRFNEEAQFSSWIYRIASNHALDVLRGRQRRTEHSISSAQADSNGLTLSDRLASARPAPDRLAASQQLQERLENALGELSPQERVAFTLRHFEGRSVEEISSTLNVTLGAARHAVFRAVQKMRRALEPSQGAVAWRS